MDHWLRILIALLPLMVACAGTSTDASRAALARASVVFVQTDQQFQPAYRDARKLARDTSPAREERDAKIVYWDAARDALAALKASLLSAEKVLDAQDAGTESDWLGAVGCVADAISILRDAWREIGQRAPPSLSGVEAALRAAAHACGGP